MSYSELLQCILLIFSSAISLKLKALHRFTSTATAVEDITALQGGKLGKGLKQFLTDEVVNKGKGKESLLVVDPNLGGKSFHILRASGTSDFVPSFLGQVVQSLKN